MDSGIIMERCTGNVADLATANIIYSLKLPAFLFSNNGLLVISNQAAQCFLQNKPFNSLTEYSHPAIHLGSLIACITLGSAALNNPTTTGDLDTYPVEYFAQDTGRRFAINWSFLESNSRLYTLMLMVDLTERDQVQFHKQSLHEALFQTSRTLSVGEMATVLAHELNQPLGAILNYLSTARHRITEDSNRAMKAIELAIFQAEQASSVIKRIREFVQVNTPQKTSLSVCNLVEQVVTLLQLEIQHHQVMIDLCFAPDLPLILADAVMMELVLVNLVKNAIEAVALVPIAERKIQISANKIEAGRIRVSVTDSGPGVLHAHRHQLFTPFFTTKSHGMGAGLAICRSIIEFHGGQLFLEESNKHLSTPRRKNGAQFVCVLPTLLTGTMQ
jgi:signal transduction histidine kinase